MKVGTLRVGVEVDTAKLQTGLKNATKNIRNDINKLGKLFLGFGIATTAALIAVTNKASDLQETTSKFNTVFRGQREEAEKWAKTLVKSYGVSTEQSRRFLASIQDLLVPMGMNRIEAGKLSNEVVQLSIDLGSFNNMPTEKVMLDIQSALVGNFETMKKYGVVLNETRVQQEIMNQGWVTNKKDITQSMKAQAAYNLIINGSTDALGDFARTSDGYANQVKIMQAGLTDLIAGLGDGFLPLMIQLVNIINTKLIPVIREWTTEFSNSGKAAQYLGIVLKVLISIIVGIVSAFDLASQAATVFALALSGHFKAAKIGWGELKTKIVEYGETFKQIAEFEIATMDQKELAKTEIINRETLVQEELKKATDKKEVKRQKDKQEKFQAFTEGLGEAWASNLTDMAMGSKSFADGLKDIWNDIARYVIQQISRMIAKYLTFLALQAATGGGLGAARSLGSFFQHGVRNFQGGMAIVGEAGPELVRLPQGSDVFSNRESKGIVNNSSSFGGDSFNISINATVRSDEDWDKVVRGKIIPSLNKYKRKTKSSPFI